VQAIAPAAAVQGIVAAARLRFQASIIIGGNVKFVAVVPMAAAWLRRAD
jgi:hypothetical protein